MTDPYRAMCVELVDKLHEHTSMWEGHKIDLVTRARALLDQPVAEGTDAVHPFVVRHYTDDEWPSIKGNGFDGLEIGEDRQEAEEFITWINERICPTPQPVAEGPTDEDLLKLVPQALDDSLSGASRAMFQNSLSSASGIYKAFITLELRFARAVLAKWGRQ